MGGRDLDRPALRRKSAAVAAAPTTLQERHVGFLSEDWDRADRIDQRTVTAITPVIGEEHDRTKEISETAAMVDAATAGVVLTRAGDTLPLPGLPDHRLLIRDSPVLTAAMRELAESGAYASFLAPIPGGDCEQFVRVTALDCAVPDLDDLFVAVLLSPPGDTRGLGTLELLVLGHLIDGTITVPAIAAALGVDATRVTDAVSAALVALAAPDLTGAAVRALRAGLRIPPQLAVLGPATAA